MTELVVATRNTNKLAELQAVSDTIHLVALPESAPDVVEGTVSLEENARRKAESATRHLGVPALADDTGFFVDSLNGHPGVLAARFGGENTTERDRRQLVLDRLLELGESATRTARYRTVLCLARPGAEPLFAEGVVEGQVPIEQRGESGFGYDAVFVPDDGDGRTFAEMSRTEKASMSHRGRAMRALLDEHCHLLSPNA